MNGMLPFGLNAGLGVGLVLLLGVSGLGLGLRLLRRFFEGASLTLAEQGLMGLGLGLGVAACGGLVLGGVGGLHRPALLAWLGVLALLGAPEGVRFTRCAVAALRAEWALPELRHLRGGLILLGLIGLVAFLNALTPPWDYDGLMYHLEGPREFLAAGRLVLLPELWQANGPANGEMLFLFGLSLGSDVFPKLLHGLFGVLWVGLGLCLGRWLGGPGLGVLTAVVLCSMPYLPLLAGWAYIDLIWFTWEGLALYLLLRWGLAERPPTTWPTLSGLLMGLALGSKYQALAALPAAGALFLFLARRVGLRRAVEAGLRFALPALGVAAPWYLKNLILGGNPVYPLFWGGAGYPPERWELLSVYLYDFGLGRRLVDLIRLPAALYLTRERFATFMGLADVPPLLLPLVLTWPLGRRGRERAAVLLGLGLVRALAWWPGTQQTRFLYPAFLWLSPLAAAGLEALAERLGARAGWVLRQGLVLGTLGATLAIQVTTFGQILQPWRLWLGQERVQAWLVRPWPDFAVQQNLPAGARVLLLWEGRGYYCAPVCLPDADHTRGVRLAEAAAGQVTDLARQLAAAGVTHVLLDRESALFSVYHDPTGRHRAALTFWEAVFLPRCGEVVRAGTWARLYRLTCTGE